MDEEVTREFLSVKLAIISFLLIKKQIKDIHEIKIPYLQDQSEATAISLTPASFSWQYTCKKNDRFFTTADINGK